MEEKIIGIENEIKTEKETTIEDITYRFEELKESFEESLNNLSEVICQQEKLIRIVADNDKDKEFKEFIEESNQQLSNLREQKEKLLYKKELISQVIDTCHTDTNCSKVISILAEAIGLFKN